MPIAASVPARPPAQVVIQKAQSGAVHANANEHPEQSQQQNTVTEAQDPGAAAHEVNLLANEVWGLLKRKMLLEAERIGKRY